MMDLECTLTNYSAIGRKVPLFKGEKKDFFGNGPKHLSLEWVGLTPFGGPPSLQGTALSFIHPRRGGVLKTVPSGKKQHHSLEKGDMKGSLY